MPAEEILDHIERTSDEETKAILDAAAKEATAYIEEQRIEIKKKASQLEDRLNKEAEGKKRLIIAKMRREAAQKEFATKEELIQEAFDMAWEKLMNLTGDLRYVSAAEYAAFASTPQASGAAAPPLEDGQPPGFRAHRQAFAPDGRYGRWLLQQPSVLIINDAAFVHAGLPPLAATMTPTELDRELKERLGALLRLRERLEGAGVIAPYTDVLDSAAQLRKRLDTTDGAAAGLEPIADDYLPDARLFVTLANDDLFSDKGPLWYRGTARCHHMLEAPVLDDVLAHWQISRAVMGHTPTPDHQVRQRFDGRAVLADTGMLKTYYKGQPAGVILSGGSVEVYYPETGTRTEGAEEIPILEIDGLGVQEVLQILQDGEVIPTAAAERPDGNLAVQVTREGRKISALFQPSDKDGTANQLAAFALDQLLGLGIVAPVVERTVDGRRGVVSALWGNAIDEAERTQRGSGLANWCGRGSLFNLMYALDALIGNDGRLPTTMIYEPATWRFMSTGHGRAFGRSAGFPAYLKNAPTMLPGGLADALEQLDEAGLEEALGELTTRGERRALLKRRDRLLSNWTSGD